MAERRMIARSIVGSDAFLDMPISAQNLYFHLNVRSADDDGFINNPKAIMKTVGANDDDLRILCAKKFVIPFECGVIVIKHWRIHNYIQSDRYNPTKYKELMGSLVLDENKAYRQSNVSIPDTMYTMDTQVRLGKDSIGEVREENSSAKKSAMKRIDEHIRTWNSLGERMPQYRFTSLNMRESDRADFLRVLTAYSDAEIDKAIRNYAEILKGTEYEAFPQYATFAGFITGGVEKYADDAKPFDRCKRKQIANYADRDEEQRAAALKYIDELRGKNV